MQMARTVVLAIVSILTGVLTIFGVTIPEDIKLTLTNHLDLLVGSIMTLYGIIMWIMRAITTSPLVGFIKKEN